MGPQEKINMTIFFVSNLTRSVVLLTDANLILLSLATGIGTSAVLFVWGWRQQQPSMQWVVVGRWVEQRLRRHVNTDKELVEYIEQRMSCRE